LTNPFGSHPLRLASSLPVAAAVEAITNLDRAVVPSDLAMTLRARVRVNGVRVRLAIDDDDKGPIGSTRFRSFSGTLDTNQTGAGSLLTGGFYIDPVVRFFLIPVLLALIVFSGVAGIIGPHWFLLVPVVLASLAASYALPQIGAAHRVEEAGRALLKAALAAA
jgi:hypothetical protein